MKTDNFTADEVAKAIESARREVANRSGGNPLFEMGGKLAIDEIETRLFGAATRPLTQEETNWRLRRRDEERV